MTSRHDWDGAPGYGQDLDPSAADFEGRALDAVRRLLESLPTGTLERLLDPREQKILRMRSGFEDGSSYGRDQIGHELRLSPEQVGDIETAAMSRLKEAGLL